MKICVYTDVHSNIEAFENLTKTEDYKTADLRIFLGDAVAVCPYPNECIEKILKSGDIWLMGNHDSYLAFGLPREEYSYFLGEKRDHQKYMTKIVKKQYIEIIKNLPKTFETTVFGKKFYFVHYPWESEFLVKNEPDSYDAKTLDNFFSDVEADYIVFGHEHFSIFEKTEKATYFCVDALGVKHPGRYVMIEIYENGEVVFQNKKIDYDLKSLRDEMKRQNYPWAQEYTKYIVED